MQMSLLNFLQYNVAGGGKSALYGVEGPMYYLRNGINQLQLALPLALGLPLLMALAAAALPAPAQPKRSSARSKKGSTTRRSADGALLWCVSPLFLWLAAITALPHKEERFLYVVYPLVSIIALKSALVCPPSALQSLLWLVGGSNTPVCAAGMLVCGCCTRCVGQAGGMGLGRARRQAAGPCGYSRGACPDGCAVHLSVCSAG